MQASFIVMIKTDVFWLELVPYFFENAFLLGQELLAV